MSSSPSFEESFASARSHPVSSPGPEILNDPFRLPNDDSGVPYTSFPSVSQLSDEVFTPPRPKFRAKFTKETFMTWTIDSVKRPFEEVEDPCKRAPPPKKPKLEFARFFDMTNHRRACRCECYDCTKASILKFRPALLDDSAGQDLGASPDLRQVASLVPTAAPPDVPLPSTSQVALAAPVAAQGAPVYQPADTGSLSTQGVPVAELSAPSRASASPTALANRTSDEPGAQVVLPEPVGSTPSRSLLVTGAPAFVTSSAQGAPIAPAVSAEPWAPLAPPAPGVSAAPGAPVVTATATASVAEEDLAPPPPAADPVTSPEPVVTATSASPFTPNLQDQVKKLKWAERLDFPRFPRYESNKRAAIKRWRELIKDGEEAQLRRLERIDPEVFKREWERISKIRASYRKVSAKSKPAEAAPQPKKALSRPKNVRAGSVDSGYLSPADHTSPGTSGMPGCSSSSIYSTPKIKQSRREECVCQKEMSVGKMIAREVLPKFVSDLFFD